MNVYCISLLRRTDRRLHIAALSSQYPCLQFHIVDAIESPNGYVGGNLSHKRVIQWAKENALPYVVVLEDDCDILLSNTDLESSLKTMISYAVQHPDIEIVNGCGNLDKHVIDSCEAFQGMYFLRSPTVYTAHFILYTSASYDKLLSSSIEVPADVVTNDCKMVYTYPYIATQLTSYSDIQKAKVDYTNIQKSNTFVKDYLQRNGLIIQ